MSHWPFDLYPYSSSATLWIQNRLRSIGPVLRNATILPPSNAAELKFLGSTEGLRDQKHIPPVPGGRLNFKHFLALAVLRALRGLGLQKHGGSELDGRYMTGQSEAKARLVSTEQDVPSLCSGTVHSERKRDPCHTEELSFSVVTLERYYYGVDWST
ncbi:hypothetical protein B0H19DRAFT_1063101 [Mycena capillaripes]|nr:hypothetical protein B0H19DRAFT_1063101 [Mycena capillaripes]